MQSALLATISSLNENISNNKRSSNSPQMMHNLKQNKTKDPALLGLQITTANSGGCWKGRCVLESKGQKTANKWNFIFWKWNIKNSQKNLSALILYLNRTKKKSLWYMLNCAYTAKILLLCITNFFWVTSNPCQKF